MPLRDGRQMFDVHNLDEFMKDRNASRRTPLAVVRDKRVLRAYVNHSRWVADCPECNGGIGVFREAEEGVCLDCGHVYRITSPTDAEVDEAEMVLDARPERNRNWRPPDETITRLRAENKLLPGVID